jgi:hypothetical protein
MAHVPLERHRHADPAFTIDVPEGIEHVEAGARGVPAEVLLAVREAAEASPSPFQSNLTVVAEPLPGGMDLEAYADASLDTESEMLPGWRLIDREQTQVGGMPAVRTLGSYLGSGVPGMALERPLSITVEQWRVLHRDTAWVVSASCETGDYALVCDTWSACAESLRPGEAP